MLVVSSYFRILYQRSRKSNRTLVDFITKFYKNHKIVITKFHGRRQRNFQGGTEKKTKNSKKHRKIALLSLYLLYLYHYENPGGHDHILPFLNGPFLDTRFPSQNSGTLEGKSFWKSRI